MTVMVQQCGPAPAPTDGLVLASPKAIEVSTMFRHREPSPSMTSIAMLLTQKQHLLSRLEEYPGPNERDEIERLLDKIDAELNAMDRPDR